MHATLTRPPSNLASETAAKLSRASSWLHDHDLPGTVATRLANSIADALAAQQLMHSRLLALEQERADDGR